MVCVCVGGMWCLCIVCMCACVYVICIYSSCYVDVCSEKDLTAFNLIFILKY